jgi:hypothetical protein
MSDAAIRHGTRTGYRSGCRCPECRESQRVAASVWRRSRGMSPRRVAAPHGTKRGYMVDRCRCTECRAWNTQKHRLAKARRMERLRADPAIVPHGRMLTYSEYGCRCFPCTAANAFRCRGVDIAAFDMDTLERVYTQVRNVRRGSHCTVSGCTRKVHARGWCRTHYREARRTGGSPRPRPLRCQECGAPFERRANALYCSTTCGQAYRRRANPLNRPIRLDGSAYKDGSGGKTAHEIISDEGIWSDPTFDAVLEILEREESQRKAELAAWNAEHRQPRPEPIDTTVFTQMPNGGNGLVHRMSPSRRSRSAQRAVTAGKHLAQKAKSKR